MVLRTDITVDNRLRAALFNGGGVALALYTYGVFVRAARLPLTPRPVTHWDFMVLKLRAVCLWT